MRNFYLTYRHSEKLAPMVREISWSNNIIIMEKCKDDLEREFYIQMAKRYGWTKRVLTNFVEARTYEKYLLNQTNFDLTIPEDRRIQAKLAVKDEYTFDFAELSPEYSEHELELQLVHMAHSGQEALEMWKKEPVDIILTDIEMPEMSGLELLKKIRSEEELVRFIILTGYDDFEYAREAIHLEVENYILKPINEEELEKQLKEAAAKLEELEKKKTETEVKAQEEPEAEEVEETTENNEPEVQVSMEGIQEKISKGIRDVFGGKTQEEKEEFPEESMDMVNEAGITREDEIPEEIIKSDASQKEPENVPELEAEPEKPGAEPMAAIKMPELNIPASMKNMELSKPPKVEEVAETKLNMDSFDLEGKELNLEDTILAAASAQGIEIPKEEESKTEEVQEESSETDVDDKEIKAHDISEELEEPDFLSGDIQDIKVADPKPDEEPKKEIPVQPEIEEAEEEDEVTEEDLRRAEEEFLHGPIGNTDLNPEDDTEGTEEAQPLTEEEELERFIESIQPENGADTRDIVPREKELTDDEKQLFTYFVKVPGMKEQLVDTLYDVQMAAADKTSKTGNIIVMGGKECGKTRLISGLIPAICKELNLEASKVAYVFADQINGKNIYKIFSKLAGGFLVIENANQLTPETVEMLDKAMEVNTDGLTVIVEDEKIGMRKLIARYPKFAKKFTSMINIPVFTNDELVNFARVYTKENGYAIDQMGMLALYNLIGINQKEDSPMNVGAVKELIDAAIAKSQGGIRKFKRNVSKKRIDRDGYIVLYEKDFTK